LGDGDRRIAVQCQPTQKYETLFQKQTKIGGGGCNHSSLGGGDLEDHNLRPAQGKKLSREIPISANRQMWWCKPMVPATGRLAPGRPRTTKAKKKRVGTWLKWQSACLASAEFKP
jgi:hypothetical protein